MRLDREVRREEALDYIGSMLGQLRDMAEAQRQPFITFLLGMSYVATYDELRRLRKEEVMSGLDDNGRATG